ncbi:hypothetical protein [Janthinobacterium sp. PSPC1-1]|uniref:hypothetical protein n=1 Tax=Janthinobacterium sp. PSPC1-1 TaxID=2804581 RepID=UPI003CE882A3
MSKILKPLPMPEAPVDLWHLLDQIEAAFAKPPDVANVRHGQRRIHQGGRGRRTSLFPSRKNNGSIPMESRLELAYGLVLEANPLVSQYRTQAVEIILASGQATIPDFLIKTVHGRYLIHEVKPSKLHLQQRDHDRFSSAKLQLWDMEIEFAVVDALDLPSESEVAALLYLYSQGHRQQYSVGQIDLAHTLLKEQRTSDPVRARAWLHANELPMDLVSYLQFHGRWTPGIAELGRPTWM